MGRNKLYDIRHSHCDCVIEVCAKSADGVSGGDDGNVQGTQEGSSYKIVAHRAVLAKATYFAGLFAHTDIARVEGGDNGRLFRAVYRVDLPFAADSLAFLANLLYGVVDACDVTDCADPVDAVNAALYLGVGDDNLVDIIEASLRVLLSNVGKGLQDATRQLGAFVLHIVHGDLKSDLKGTVLGRTFGMLSEADRLSIPADMVPRHYYRPEAAVGDSVEVDEDGRRWRTISVPWDEFYGCDDDDECKCEGACDGSCGDHDDDPRDGGEREIVWQGIRFGVSVPGSCHDEDGRMEVMISAVPDGEVLGSWPKASATPSGFIDAAPRAATVVIRAYHPTSSTETQRNWVKPSSIDKADKKSLEVQRAAYAATGWTLDCDMALVPNALSAFSRSVGLKRRPVRRAKHVVCLDAGVLLACVVDIRVQELSSM